MDGIHMEKKGAYSITRVGNHQYDQQYVVVDSKGDPVSPCYSSIVSAQEQLERLNRKWGK